MARRIECDGCGKSHDMEESLGIASYRFGRTCTEIGNWQGDLCKDCNDMAVALLKSLRKHVSPTPLPATGAHPVHGD